MRQSLLIADGDAELCDLYEMLLAELGYDVETATNGLDCLRKLHQSTPDILVLDLDLRWGGADGVLDCLRDENSTHRIPVILTAADGYPNGWAESIDAPVVAYLPRPFTVTDLVDRLDFAIAEIDRHGRTSRHRTFSYSNVLTG